MLKRNLSMCSFNKISALIVSGLLFSCLIYAEELFIDKEILDNINLDDLPEGETPYYKEVKKPVIKESEISPSKKRVARPVIRTKEKVLSAKEISEYSTSTSKEEWRPIESDAQCVQKLAGFGKRAKAICFDMIHKSARGPLLVVLPTNEEFQDYFAISKYEVTYSDFSKYCILSGVCPPTKDKTLKNMPVTNITVNNIQTYIVWLSDRTGYKYRLPTPKEWEYAAKSDGTLPKDLNCASGTGIKKVIGTGVVSVKTGHDNAWGLRNALGNVEEFVEDESGNVFSIGSTYLDRCSYELTPKKKDSRSELTGFRFVREM